MFKVGDRILVTGCIANEQALSEYIGNTYTVTRADGDWVHTAEFGGGWSPDRFRLADETSLIANYADINNSDEVKPTNPKDMIGSNKLPLHLWPNTATLHGCLALLDGASKYGRSNFREIGVRASIYVDAAKRHLDAWFEGEGIAPDSGVHHLGHALACIAIILDAEAAGKLNDDRVIEGGYLKLVEELTPLVAKIKERHKDKNPKHYTIADNKKDKA